MLKKLTVEEIDNILKEHKKWLNREGGTRADLSGADLSEADLSGADISWADLSGADLSGANLSRANLSGANISWANISGANISRANLSRANLSGADLSGANISGADLSWANLSRANLSGANISGADLSGANISRANLSGADLSWAKNSDYAIAMSQIVPECGDFIGWKKCRDNVIVKLLIPSKAKRSNASGRKCRAEFVKVLQVYGAIKGISQYDKTVEYVKNKIVKCHKWDDNKFNECSGGIHFFISRIEAENY